MIPTKPLTVEAAGERIVVRHGDTVVLDLDGEAAGALSYQLGESTAWMTGPETSLTPDDAGQAVGELFQQLTGIGMGLQAIGAPPDLQGMLAGAISGMTDLMDELAEAAAGSIPVGGRPASFVMHGQMTGGEAWVQLSDGVLPDGESEQAFTIDVPPGLARVGMRITPARVAGRTGLLSRPEGVGIADLRLALDDLEAAASGVEIMHAIRAYIAQRAGMDDLILDRVIAAQRREAGADEPEDGGAS